MEVYEFSGIIIDMQYFFALLFFVGSIVVRSIPHIPNVAPIGALALWSGTYLPKRWGWVVPVTAMLVSDRIVGMYDWRLMLVVYVSFAVTALIGLVVRRNGSGWAVLAGSLAGSIIFYLATNFAVWALSEWYPHTLQGLAYAYTLGLPFFRNTLLGDIAYTTVFFGAYQIGVTLLANRRQQIFHPLTKLIV